jgi:hypothetical protein
MPIREKRIQPDAGDQGCSLKSSSRMMAKIMTKIYTLRIAHFNTNLANREFISIDYKTAP